MDKVCSFVRALRARGVAARVSVGLPGPASLPTMLKEAPPSPTRTTPPSPTRTPPHPL